ncbi:Acyl-CoA 6-desaturase [Schistosoma japonicum]|nr:Acyl-CoA 6-desaturase [Schistosoma japonicum]
MAKPLVNWGEVKKHQSLKDRWIVIDKKVYDVSSWQNKHPGGRKVIGHYAGQDATGAFIAFHKNRQYAEKFLSAYHVADLDQKCPEDEDINSRIKEYHEDLEGIRSVLLRQAQASWLQHDLGHLSVFKSTRTNHIFHEIILGLTKGASCHWWNHMHSQHHAKPNVIDKDPDVRLEPVFVIGDNMPRRAASSDSKWTWHFPYEHQHKYFFLSKSFILLYQYVIFVVSVRHRLILVGCHYKPGSTE